MATKTPKRAILRYQDKNNKNHRVMCDPQKATKIMPFININKAQVGDIYITHGGIIFLEKNGELMLPDTSVITGVTRPLAPPRLNNFIEGQETIKDYIAKKAPDTYLKFFNDVQEIEED